MVWLNNAANIICVTFTSNTKLSLKGINCDRKNRAKSKQLMDSDSQMYKQNQWIFFRMN